MSSQVDTAVTTLAAAITAKAATATPEELAYLSKAMEGIGGKTTVIDVALTGEAKKVEISDLTTAKKGEVETLATGKKGEIVDLATAKKAEINTLADQRDAAYATTAGSLTNKVGALARDGIVKVAFAAGTDTITLTAADLAGVIEVDTANDRPFTAANIVMPDATTLAAYLGRQIVFRNKCFRTITVKSATGATIGTITPTAWGVVTPRSVAAAAGTWSFINLSIPNLRDKTFSGVVGTTYMGENSFNYRTDSGSYYPTGVSVVPCEDPATGKASTLAIVTGYYATSANYSAWVAPPSSDPSIYDAPAGAGSHCIYSGAFREIAVAPAKGGAWVLTTDSSFNGYVHYVKPSDFAVPGAMAPIATIAVNSSTEYYHLMLTFSNGEQAVVITASSSGVLQKAYRYRVKADGTAEAAGSISLGAGAFVSKIDEKTFGVFSGGAFSAYDVSSTSASLVPTQTLSGFSTENAGLSNRIGVYLGRGVFLSNSGLHQYDGSSVLINSVGTYGHNTAVVDNMTGSGFNLKAAVQTCAEVGVSFYGGTYSSVLYLAEGGKPASLVWTKFATTAVSATGFMCQFPGGGTFLSSGFAGSNQGYAESRLTDLSRRASGLTANFAKTY